MDLLERLISTYEENEDLTIDEVLQTILKHDPAFSELSEMEIVDLKRRFVDYIRSEEERSSYEELRERSHSRDLGPLYDSQIDDISKKDQPSNVVAPSLRRKRPHIKHVEAFINNISVPNSLEELQELFLDGNSAQILVNDVIYDGFTCWTSPKWAKWGDIVLFMHAKTANSTLTRLRTQVRTQLDPDSSEAIQFEKSIADQIAFHKKYGGKIYAIGRVNGVPEKLTIDPIAHYKSNMFCDIGDLFLLDNPIHISKFNSFITISRLSGITPVYGEDYERLKTIISENNDVPEYFRYSYSTPFPHSLVNEKNWMKLGLEYRYSFTLEVQFRQCYVNYLLRRLGDQKTIYMECSCYKANKPVTFVDNVIRIDRKLLPVEIKLNIKAESDLEGQCEQYCKLDNIVLSKNAKQPVNMKNLIDDRVLVIDTFAVYMFFLKDRNIKFLCDLDELKSEKDIQLLKNKVLQCIRNT